jgi:hypothetical protein
MSAPKRRLFFFLVRGYDTVCVDRFVFGGRGQIPAAIRDLVLKQVVEFGDQ